MKPAYFYTPSYGSHSFGYGHPMKPIRSTLTHDLIVSYGLHNAVDTWEPNEALPHDLMEYHTADYIDFLRTVNPSNVEQFSPQIHAFLGRTGSTFLGPSGSTGTGDCPVIAGLWDMICQSCGSSLGCAAQIISGEAKHAISWMGGYHHARREHAAGFCYANDIILSIIELLKAFPRVMYIDIDIHHGDAIEEAFYNSNRVMTVSFHQYGSGFFPGTGDLNDKGFGGGKGYAINVPLEPGITDIPYVHMFRSVVSRAIDHFRPSVIVVQCGADSLAGDRLGTFNLTLSGHGACVDFIRRLNIPSIFLGGGGYTVSNVARCWTFETALIAGVALEDKIPEDCSYPEYFSQTNRLNILPTTCLDQNNPEKLLIIEQSIMETLRSLPCAPGVGTVRDIPKPLSLELIGFQKATE